MRWLNYVAALLLAPVSAAAAAGGHIFALSLNGTNNLPNLLAADLSTYEIRAGPPLAGVELIGQACAVDAAGATLFAFGVVRGGGPEMLALLAVDTRSGALLRATNASAWPGAAGRLVFIEAIFADGGAPGAGAGALLVVARAIPPGGGGGGGEQLVFRVDAATGAAALLGAVSVAAASDVAYDAARGLLYSIDPGANDDESGSLNTIALAPAPRVVASVPLAAHFSFPQVLGPAAGALVGLTLATAPDGSFARNLTTIDAATGAEASVAQLGGGFYVVLEDGPKAIDAAGGRAFYMLATGPFGEFDVVAVDLATGAVGESVGLCGFIGCGPRSAACARRCAPRP